MDTKNDVSASSNKRNFSLLGDVALKLSYPRFEVETTSINGTPLDGVNQETVNSLQEVTVAGRVT
ncbi:MAG: hypothetical protein AAF193_08480, partial [Bacteroidota bacterium]